MKNKLWSTKHILVAGFISFGVIFISLWLFNQSNTHDSWELLEVEPVTEKVEIEMTETILVDVKGAVHKPGVYELSEGARMQELILLAGGLTDDAEERQLNFASKLSDQQLIYMPTKEEAAQSALLTPLSSDANRERVNINTADSGQLQTLTGIGPSKAEAIINYREENGTFKSIDDLSKVDGFGTKTVDKLRDSVEI